MASGAMAETKRTLTACIVAVLQQSYGGTTPQFSDEADACGPDVMPEVSRPTVPRWRGGQVRASNLARHATPKRFWKPRRR